MMSRWTVAWRLGEGDDGGGAEGREESPRVR